MGARRLWRQQALQALYAVSVGRRDPAEAIDEIVGARAGVEQSTFVRELVRGTLDFTTQADAIIAPLLASWTIERLPSVDRCLLRMAAYELRCRPDIPTAVAISEAVALAKKFSTEDSGRFVNGVLSAIVRSHAQA